MNQIPNIEEEKSDCELYEHIPEPYDVAFWHCKVCGKELYFDTIESLTKTHSDTVDKTTELLTLHLPSLDKSVIRDTISVALHQQLQKAREEERERIVKTIRRKTLEWSSQYHLQNFDRTLSHQSGMAVGYSVATKALDHLLAGIQSGAPLDHSELDQPINSIFKE